LKEGYLPQGVASNRQIEHRSRRNKKLKLWSHLLVILHSCRYYKVELVPLKSANYLFRGRI
jgi:hypothetical protein